MDSAWVSGTQNPGSIPGEATKRDNSNLLEKSPRLFSGALPIFESVGEPQRKL